MLFTRRSDVLDFPKPGALALVNRLCSHPPCPEHAKVSFYSGRRQSSASSALSIRGDSRRLRKVDSYLVHEFATGFLDVGRKHDIEKTPSRLRLASWCFSARRRPPA